ncbi:acetolactate synthase large subunit [Actibacterium ureilyticum]|uniref:acetolactate synthase large subunit n=1 Tax=Actibacterium ureilyticum TaxID=1590614 RepID=UPI000BAAE7C8|nr:acetolactate synthase large subunit [Actibacterium ureilyticum]
MNGAESLVRTFLDAGVTVCFANPGTSEMHFVAALDAHPDMRCVLCLFEGGTTGAADGYFRMTRDPAATLLHLAPGFGNAFANAHNAAKAGSGMVNVVGDHATYHQRYESPLKSDAPGVSRTVSDWTRVSGDAASVATDGAAAVQAARGLNGQVATLILPANTAWDNADVPAATPAPAPLRQADDAAIAVAADALRQPGAALMIGGGHMSEGLLHLGGQIAQATGCRLMGPYFTPRIRRGAGTARIDRLAYHIDQNTQILAGTDTLVLCGAARPVGFFAYPGKPSLPEPPGCRVIELCDARMDYAASLQSLARAVGVDPETAPPVEVLDIPDLPTGKLDAEKVGAVVAHLMPENAIMVDEGVTSSAPVQAATRTARPHDWLHTMGGAIGNCLPMAVGAAVACPERKVIAQTGDGSAMYTIQSLWTMAREQLDVTVIVFANRGYQILWGELSNVGAGQSGRNAAAMFDIANPELDFVALALGHGVPGVRAETAEDFATALRRGLETPGPFLIEAVI